MSKYRLFFLFISVILSFQVLSGEVVIKDRFYFYPELNSPSWSPDLSYEDIKKIRIGISEISSEYGDHGYALGLLAPYIKDKRNIEARFYYAFGLTRSLFGGNADKAKGMLLELVDEGWPLAIEALKDQACEAEKLKLRCERLGYSDSKRLVYLEWARKDPLHVWMYSKATRSSTYLKNPEEELSEEEYEYLLYGKGVKGIGNYEKIKILNEGISKGCTTCSIQLYNRFFLKILSDIDKEVTISKYNVKKLKELAGITKELLYLGGDYNSYLQLKLVSFSELDEDYKIKYSKVYDMYNVPTFTENEMLKFVEIYAEKGSANFFLNSNFTISESINEYILKYLQKESITTYGKWSINRENNKSIEYKELNKLNKDRGWIHRLSHIHIDWNMHEKWKKDQQEAGLDSNMFGNLESN